MNYHTLSDFRLSCTDLLDRLLCEHVAALAQAGIIDLATLAQDGVRVRASAGAASFRRQATLDWHLAMAQAVVEELKREVTQHPDARNQRIKAAKERAARERVERLAAAQKTLCEIKAQGEERACNLHVYRPDGSRHPPSSSPARNTVRIRFSDPGEGTFPTGLLAAATILKR